MIREYTPDDIIFIEQLGKIISNNYKFKINQFTRCLMYEQDKVIIGFITYTIIYEKAEIIDLVVDSNHQKNGVGSALINAVIKECTDKKCENVTLEVRVGNQKAISFYRKHGFREISMRKSYYHNNEDALVMIKMVN